MSPHRAIVVLRAQQELAPDFKRARRQEADLLGPPMVFVVHLHELITGRIRTCHQLRWGLRALPVGHTVAAHH